MVHAPEHSCVQARSQKAPLIVDAAVSEQPSAAIMSGQVPMSIAIRIATIVFNVLILCLLFLSARGKHFIIVICLTYCGLAFREPLAKNITSPSMVVIAKIESNIQRV